MRILIVDDDKTFAEQMVLCLKQRFSLLSVATSVEEAAEQLRCKPYDVVLLDYYLGTDENGLELMDIINVLTETPRVIMMTGFATKDLVIQSVNMGINKFIEKPFGTNEILDLIQTSSSKKVHNLKIDAKEHKIFDNGKEINLTEIEYKIVSFMLLNSGALITKDELHEFIYKDQVKARNAINTHITNLKNKSDGFSNSLSTIRGQGYVFKSLS